MKRRLVLRYALAVALVGAAFGIRILLRPITGTGAPFVLFFGAVVAASLWAGPGPGICATLLSIPLGAYEFVMRAGFSVPQAATQAALFAVDGGIIVYLSLVVTRARRAAETSEAGQRELIELSPDAFFLADLDGRFTEVNQSACRMLGCGRGELVGKTIADILPPEDVPRLAAVRAALLVPGQVDRAEWKLRRKDGALIPVEVSSNILPGGRWQAFVRDISEARRTAQEREQLLARERLTRQQAETANAELRESEERFRLTIDEAPIGMALVALDGRFVRVNPALSELLGYTVEELQGMRFQDITHADDLDADVALVDRLIRGEIPRYQLEKRYVRKDGRIVSILISGSILRSPDGVPLYGIAQMQDITERKRAEEALRLSEARFSGIISISADAIISIDEDQRISIFNDGAQNIFGYARAEAIGAPLDILIPERFQAVHRQHIAAFAAGPTTSRRVGDRLATIMGRRKNGEEFPAEAAISKLEVGGRPILTVALRDITQRKRAEEEQRFLAETGALLASSLDYEQTLSTLGQLMVRDLADWCIVDLVESDNRPRRLKVISARASQAPLAAQLEQLQLDRGLPHLAEHVLDTRRPFIVERMTPEKIELLAQSDEHLRILRAVDPRLIMGLPLLAHGELLGVLILISSDPSRRYKQEDLRMAGALAERAALAIENGRLYQTAVHATRLRDEVLGVVAHDLRNPVAAITMAATALRRRGPEGEPRSLKPVEAIIRTAGRMNRLIGDLLDVSLIEAGQLGIERAPVSTRQLLADAVEAQRPLASSASIEMRIELGDDLPDVWGDQQRLLQVLENLVGNAIKFTPVQGRITVGAARREGEVLFWVADTGGGISPDGLPHVFDRFWQARKGARQGAGLGLPITRGIIEAHGGRIWVESTLGRGSVFFFTVPEPTGAEARPSKTMH